MTRTDIAHLELLAEVDTLVAGLERWADGAPHWRESGACQAVIRRLTERTQHMRIRMDAPLVVATLGGTGTGKSALVNALVGDEVVASGRSRPTTTRPALICRPDIRPDDLGIPAESVDIVHRDLPPLADLVVIDCPDPDTTEDAVAASTNLARLRTILPHCDVLVVTATQQKYRSARVRDELAMAAPGARLVFVQTHADVDQDVRDDWRSVLGDQYEVGSVFFVDSIAALADARAGLRPRGPFGELVDLLTRQLAGVATTRIRRANFLDLIAEVLDNCRTRIDGGLPPVDTLQDAIRQQRIRLATGLAEQMRVELLASRRQWEQRLLGKVASRWGFSPFSIVLRLFQGLGGLIAGSLLFRVRSPGQLALWGAMQGTRSLRSFKQRRNAERSVDRAVEQCWSEGELREAALVLDGYAAEAGLNRQSIDRRVVDAEAAEAGRSFVATVAGELDALIARVAKRQSGWFTRFRYETLLLAMLGLLLFRPAKNFFYDSWAASWGFFDHPVPAVDLQPVHGLDFYLVSLFWLVLWCGVLLWGLTGRLRRGLRREIGQLAQGWHNPEPVHGIFAELESEAQSVEQFSTELDTLRTQVDTLRRQLTQPEQGLGRCK